MTGRIRLAIALAAAAFVTGAAVPALAGAEEGSGTVTYVTVRAEIADIGDRQLGILAAQNLVVQVEQRRDPLREPLPEH